MGCVVLFILAAIAFIVFSVPRLKKMEAQRTIEQECKDSATMERAWKIADSVKRERLLEDPDYVDLLEKIGVLLEENEALRDSIRRINEHR